MASSSVFDRIARHGIIPVIALDKVEAALPLADALIGGGLPVIEITFRTAAAAEIIRTLSYARPQLAVGAGTVLTAANLEAAHANGAAFAVAPGLNPEIVRQAQGLGLPFVPGVATPTDIEAAMALGCKVLKFFPAEALGGVAMLDALSGPYRHTGVRFVPTGGLSLATVESYLRLETVAAAGGTWLARQEDLTAGRWDEIRDRCRVAVAIVAQARDRRA